MTRLRVLAPGLRATVQDAGRAAHLRSGIPPGGAADGVAFEAAQRLVGNAASDALIEIVGTPFTFELAAPRLVAVTGREVSLRTRGTIGGWTSAFVRAHEEVTVEGGERTRFAYLAVAGGIALEPVLGSRAAYLPAGLGPLARPLRAGDELPLGPARRAADRAGRSVTPLGRDRIGVIRGPHAAAGDALETFLGSEYRVSDSSDRMGVRLAGPPLRTRGEVLSLGVLAGAVQVPHGGGPIVLLADHQTTGGYPVVATVIRADLPAVAQTAPGDPLSFYEVRREEAVAAWRAVRRWLDAIDR